MHRNDSVSKLIIHGWAKFNAVSFELHSEKCEMRLIMFVGIDAVRRKLDTILSSGDNEDVLEPWYSTLFFLVKTVNLKMARLPPNPTVPTPVLTT